MVADLRSDKYTALVLDASVLEYVTSHNEACDLFLMGETFESFSTALAFPPAFPEAAVYNFSKNIVRLQVRVYPVFLSIVDIYVDSTQQALRLQV
jgi:hypothetical protein